MTQTYRLDIQVSADSAIQAMTRLEQSFDKAGDASKKAEKALSDAERHMSKTGQSAYKTSQDLDKAGSGFKKVGKDAHDAGDGIKKADKDMSGMNATVNKLNNTLGAFKTAMLGAMAFVGIGSVVQTADAMKTLDGQIRIATNSAEQHAKAMSEVERIAMANHVSLQSVGEMYVSNARSLKQLGKDQNDVIKFTEQVTMAMRLGGGSAEAQAAALTQLGQAMASGVLRGDEFNSIAEQAPVIMELMADSLGVTTGELRKLAGEGKLTAEAVYQALTSASATDKLASMASQTSTTIGGALEDVRTQWDLAVHNLLNSDGGISSLIADGIGLIGQGLQQFGDYLPQVNEVITNTITKAKELGSAFVESDIGQATIEALKTAFDGLKTAIEAVVDVGADITQFFQENPELAIALASGIGAATIAFGAYQIALWGVTAATTAWATITSVAAGAFAILTSPITLTVAAIAGLVAVGVYLYRNWDTIKAKASEVWTNIKQAISDKINEIKKAFSEWLSNAPEPVKKMVENITSIFDGLTKVWDTVKNAAKQAWEGLKTSAKDTWNQIKEVWSGVKPYFQEIWNGVKAIFQIAWQALTLPPKIAFETIKAAVKFGIDSIKAVISAGVSIFASYFNLGFGLIKTTVTTAFNVIKALMRGDMQGVKDAINNGVKQAVQLFKNFSNDARATIKKLGSDLLQVGRDAVQGLINGIGEKIGAAVQKARELASQVKNAVTGFLDIHSPSRVMKQLGEWTAEGFALGIAYKAPMAVKEAQKLAEDAKNALQNDMEQAAKNIYKLQLQQQENPFADAITEIKFGKYGNENTDRLLQLKQEELAQQNILDVTNQIRQNHAAIKTLGMDRIGQLRWEYDNTNKFIGVSRKMFDAHLDYIQKLEQAQKQLAATADFDKEIADIDKQLALLGNDDPLAEFRYNLEHTKKQMGYTAEQLDKLNQKMMALQDSKDKLARKEKTDKQKKDSADSFDKLKSEIYQVSPAEKLRAEYQDKLKVIAEYEDLHTDKLAEALQARHQLKQQYEQAQTDLQLASYEMQLSGVAGLMKDILGESSRGYKAIFAMEKGMALARILLANKEALAKAWASAPFPANLGAVAKVALESGALVAAVNAIKPVVGQAHDGIMSVPKSGTWNLEKGERVLPKHTAKALDKKLDSIGGSGGTAINISVTVNSNGSSDVQSDAQTGKSFGNAIKAAVQNELMRQRRQGGMLYGV
ncbi:tape measure protein [Moraxella sp. ZJ142]|uniref:tape measure protein n=1 Tax=Moraxella marmotae TaxID=3344520 RepID=UPI0035D3E41F